MFVFSKGYYVEWIRPDWIRESTEVRGFDFSEPDNIRQRLVNQWVRRKPAFEKEFYENRIPINEPKNPG